MKRFATAILLCLCAAAPAQALNCDSPANTVEMDRCAGRDFEAADAKLNALYRAMSARYDAANRTLLKAAEKSWILYRDAECAFETNATVGGTINSTMITQCRTRKTDARIRELNAQLQCVQGDLSCNLPAK
jgi:uncharacterized protein YecT (DUF1311 family)